MNPFARSPIPSSFLTTHALVSSLALVVLFALGCDDSNALDTSPAAGTSNAALSAAQVPQARLRVRVEPVRLARMATGERVTGTVRAFHRAVLTAETQGRVLARAVEPGAQIEAGSPIVELEASRFRLEVQRSQATLSAARTVLRHAARELERGEQLRAQNAISTQLVDDLRLAVDRARDEIALAEVARDTARRNLADTRIEAPFAGTVDSIAVNVGDFVAPGTPVATLVDLSRVRIFGGVTAREAARLTPGTVARVSFADLGGAIFEATLKSVGRVAQASDGTFGLELWMDDPGGRMRDGLVAQIELPDPDEAPRLLARRAALLRRDGRPEVFVVEGRGQSAVARTRMLVTGRSEGQWVEILEGLAEGDRVIWDGQFALEDGTAVLVDGEATEAARADATAAAGGHAPDKASGTEPEKASEIEPEIASPIAPEIARAAATPRAAED